MPRWRFRDHGDDGAGVVEFVLLTVLLVLLLFAVLQVAVWFYARSIVASAAADAARYTASTGGTPAAGQARAGRLIADGLNARAAHDIGCTDTFGTDTASGLPITTVRCEGRPHMLLLPFPLPLGIDVRSSVLREQAP